LDLENLNPTRLLNGLNRSTRLWSEPVYPESKPVYGGSNTGQVGKSSHKLSTLLEGKIFFLFKEKEKQKNRVKTSRQLEIQNMDLNAN